MWLAGPECDTCGSKWASRPISAWVRRPPMGPWLPDPHLLLTSLSALRPCCLRRRAVFRTYSPSPSFRLAALMGQIMKDVAMAYLSVWERPHSQAAGGREARQSVRPRDSLPEEQARELLKCASESRAFRGPRGKESTCQAGEEGSTPGLGRSSGEGNGNPLPYPCLGNPHGQMADPEGR